MIQFQSLSDTLIIEGTTWFVGKDVAAICGYKDTWKAIKYHVSPEKYRSYHPRWP